MASSTLTEKISLHPLLDNLPSSSTNQDSQPSLPITLACHCPSSPVKVTLNHQILHNHACGCSKCWKPSGSLFSVVGVVPSASLVVIVNEEKLAVIDPSTTILRYACKECGIHLYGRIEREHVFRGLDFVHSELSTATGEGEGKKGQVPIEFAAFVSSIIEGGFEPHLEVKAAREGEEGEGKENGKWARMREVRRRLKEIFGEKVYDCLSPGLMDVVAEWEGRRGGKLKSVA